VYIEKDPKVNYAFISFIEIQRKCAVKHNILEPNNNVLHVSLHQNQNQAFSS